MGEPLWPAHTYSADCPRCGNGQPGTRCDLSGYSPRRVRFLLTHRESLEAAYLNPSGAAASNELARLEREYQTLPPRHSGWCRGECPSERCGLSERDCAKRGHFHAPCIECRRLRNGVQYQDIGAEFVSRKPAGSRVPDAAMLDLERAIEVIGGIEDPRALARYMTYDGAVTVQQPADVVHVTRSAVHDAAPVATLPVLGPVAVACDCLGFRMGGAAYCVHQPQPVADTAGDCSARSDLA